MLNKLPQNETLADRAYKEMKKAILQGTFMPGDPLPEESIASMLGISRTPLRKAINQLAFDGLVELETGKKARVANFTEEDLQHFIRLREVLEVFAAEQAVPFVTDEFLQKLEQTCIGQMEAIQKNDYYTYIELDSQFHVLIAEVTQNPKLKDFVEQISNQLLRFLVLSRTIEESADEALVEHQQIIQALADRDVAKAGATMRKHIQSVERRAKMKPRGNDE
ncbi:GntR family transcriptional regulator [Brevibacillus sp. TJ4]|uniref:GntR family transcriptional regulator n=1 Tax=Brevibacillus sp. TJ4 TaxID=3234853 RepID=UPI0037D3A192